MIAHGRGAVVSRVELSVGAGRIQAGCCDQPLCEDGDLKPGPCLEGQAVSEMEESESDETKEMLKE